ncbi:MAG TPA: nitroreductase family protein [Ornithinimicrobium sp.]|uniref:nitroreductase family protein n=1 Tax=Ornithinimicrobium sp. TaxID=1977084 RepID=UPI002B48D0EA|nr:nitroreductase family protein [Ornithinimicrobium sp.]HKJ13037.1 nitroreductase family protein [Ornithinimicrobium sp.]
MELADAVRRRRMRRSFDPVRPLPPETVEAALEAATHAPSAGFSQGWDFVVLLSPAERARFWDAALATAPDREPDRWLRGVSAAPCLIVCCSDPQRYRRRYAEPDKATDTPRPWPIPYWDVDTGMAALLMLLTAVDHDLGGLFFGVPADAMDAVRAALDIPSDRRLVGVVALGYPGADGPSAPRRRHRRAVAEVAHAGRFGRAWSRRASSSG